MPFNPKLHHRQSLRLQHYDYSQTGAYFVTICTHQRNCLLGDVVDGAMVLSALGLIVQKAWDVLPFNEANIELDACVVMPNHVHGIIVLQNHDLISHGLINQGAINLAPTEADGVLDRVGARFIAPKDITPKKLGEIVRVFKAKCSYAVNKVLDTQGVPLWQRNYFERVIRNDDDLAKARQYIQNNPLQWHLDRENPERVSGQGLINKGAINQGAINLAPTAAVGGGVLDGVGAQFIAPKEHWGDMDD